jgi:segregation and condensation protein B
LGLTRQFDWLRSKVLGRTREARLSQAAIDVLAIVAYEQPLTAEDVSRLRGIPSNHVLAQLVRRQLLRIERSAGKPGTARYYTTERFLELFGLESLEDIPQSEELERR